MRQNLILFQQNNKIYSFGIVVLQKKGSCVMKEDIKERFMQSIECKTKVINDDKIISQVEDVCNKLIECYKNGHRVYIMGNGGSAADAQHFSAELVGRYMMERKGLPAVAFTTDTSILTAVGNDYGYDDVFRRQTEALVEKGDVVFGISTSGNSKNIYNALKLAKEIGATTIGFLGKTGGTCKELCDIPIVIEYPRTPNIQEAHEMIMHTICEIVEKKLYE